MSELSGHDCPRCEVELYIEASDDLDGVDLLICKQCWGVGVTAKSMEMVITKGNVLDENRDNLAKSYANYGECDCPMCKTKMDEIELEIPKEVSEKISLIDNETLNAEKVVIDSCSNCPTFWFDAGELDLLNGIRPKTRGGVFDKKTVRLIEDQTLTEEDLKKKRNNRIGIGIFAILGAIWIGMSGGILLQIIMGLVGIGGLIAVFTKNPESNLVTGTCDKCLKPDKSLAWNCQSGGCWAHICSDCQSVGEDPVEAYAKTLGQVAVGTVIIGVGALALFATDGAGSFVLDGVGAAGDAAITSGSSSKKKKSMLLCKECTDRTDKIIESRKDKKKQQKVPEPPLENIGSNDGHCTFIDPKNNKRCKRLEFRKSGLCYVHK